MSKDFIKYIKDIEILFPIMQKEEKKYIDRIKQSIIKQVDIENILYQELVNQFGSPNDITQSYINEIDIDELISKTRKHRDIKKFITGTCFFIIICALIVALWRMYQINQEREDFMNHVPIEYIEEIEVIE